MSRRANSSARSRWKNTIASPAGRPFFVPPKPPPMKGWIAKLFGLLPVLTLTKSGTAEAVARARGFEPALQKMMRLLFSAARSGNGSGPSRERRFGVAHCDASELAERLAREIHDDIGPTLTALKFVLTRLARERPTPSDWVYVHNTRTGRRMPPKEAEMRPHRLTRHYHHWAQLAGNSAADTDMPNKLTGSVYSV